MNTKHQNFNIYLSAFTLLMFCFLSQISPFVYVLALFAIPVLNAYIVYAFMPLYAVLANIAAVIFCFTINFPAFNSGLISFMSVSLLLIPGIILGYCFKKKKTFNEIAVFSVAYDFLIFVILMAIVRFVYDVNFTEFLHNALSETFSESFAMIKSINPLVADVFNENEHDIFNAFYIGLPGFVPFAAAIVSMVIFLLRFVMCRIFCVKIFIKEENFASSFDCFRPGLITNCCAIISLFFVYMSEINLFTMACFNLLLIVLCVYFAGGLSLLENKIKQKVHYPGRRLFAILTIIVSLIFVSFIIPIINLPYLFIFMGFADSLFDFRKLKQKKGEFYEE